MSKLRLVPVEKDPNFIVSSILKLKFIFIHCSFMIFIFKGGGELVDVMRVANRTKDYTQIDALIKEHIPKFLYNNGEGKLVEIKSFTSLSLSLSELGSFTCLDNHQ